MENTPVVTIGICARNAERTIGYAIQSLFTQDFPAESMEVILVDDNSEDRTLWIMRDYVAKADLRFRVFRGDHRGLGYLRNIVINNAEGKYIIWVDADMTLPKDYVRKQVEFMENNPRVGIAGGKFCGLPESSLVVTLENLEWMAIEFANRHRKSLNMQCHVCGGAIYRKEVIRKMGGFDVNITGAGEDEEIEWRVARAGWKACMETEALFYERRKKTWKALWKQFSWYGYGAHFLLHKGIRTVKPSNLLNGLVCSDIAYRLTHRKVAFLLPIQYYFKRIAWYSGFLRAHLQAYGHTQL